VLLSTFVIGHSSLSAIMSEQEHWDNRYVKGDTPWDSGRPSQELVRVLDEERITPCRAIDLGCGTGSNAIYLASLGFDVTAADISPTAIDRCRMRRATTDVRIRCIQADLLDPPDDIGGSYSFFLDRACYHVVRRVNVEAYFRTLDRIIAPSALGLVMAGNAREPMEPGPPTVTEEELRADWEKLFEIIWLREFRFDATNGGGARPLGWSFLVRRR
jgi:SAM-dependent methyltransferase